MDSQLAALGQMPGGRGLRHLSLSGDERLAKLVGQGSEHAFAALYERYHERLYRYCRSMLHNDADAQDALQSTFVGAFAALGRGQRVAPMRPWLYQIAHNESVSILRRRRPDIVLAEAGETPTPSAEDQAGDRERLALLVADLGELSERQRGALVMRELGGLSHEDIALALGLTVAAAKSTIFEARRSLAEFAQGRAMACDQVCRTISDGSRLTLRGRKFRAHLRDCSSCAAFAAAISERPRGLRAIAPPLSVLAATGLLKRVLEAGSGQGGGGAGMAAGTTGKGVAVALSAKAIAGAAIVATVVTATVTGALSHSTHGMRLAARSPQAALTIAPTLRTATQLARTHATAFAFAFAFAWPGYVYAFVFAPPGRVHAFAVAPSGCVHAFAVVPPWWVHACAVAPSGCVHAFAVV